MDKYQAITSVFLADLSRRKTMVDTYQVEVVTVDANAQTDMNNGRCLPVVKVQEKTHNFDQNLQKQLMSEHNIQCKLKLREWSKLLADKGSLMTIIYGQCDDATRTKIALSTDYNFFVPIWSLSGSLD